MVGNTLTAYFPDFTLGRKEAIFGDVNSKGNSVINTMILLAKQFLWRQKFGSKTLNEIQYILFMKQELQYLQEIMNFKGDKIKFCTEWLDILLHFNVN